MSPRESYDPFKDESLGRKPPPKTRIRIDWKRGAKLLAAGEPPEAVAAALGIEEDRLWRHLNRSPRFQFLLRQALERQMVAAQLQFGIAGRQASVQRCGRAEALDGESWQWLSRETGITTDEAAKAEQSRKMVAALGAAGRRQARPKRPTPAEALAEARRGVVNAIRARGLGAGFPAQPSIEPAVRPAPDKIETGADKPQVSADKTHISADKTHISTDKTQISSDKFETDADKAASATGYSPPPDDRPFPRHLYGSVSDLTDLHGNPLPGVQHLRRE